MRKRNILLVLNILLNAQIGASPSESNAGYDVYLPNTKSQKYPLFIFVHGGAWVSGAKEHYAFVADALTKKNIATALIEYRLSSKNVKHPTHALDAERQIELLLASKKISGVDLKRVFLGGHSAGAFTTAYLADRPIASKIKGFIGLSGIFNIPALGKKFPEYKKQFLNLSFGEIEKLWPDLKAPTSLQSWLLIHSKADELVDTKQSQDFAALLKKSGHYVVELYPETRTHFDTVKALSDDSNIFNSLTRFILKTP